MIVDVLLESQRLIVSEATAPEELQSLTYINIVRVLPIIREQRNFSVDGAPILYEQWYARLIDATNTQLDIPLGNLASQPGWTNDQAGYDQAEIDIYAAFPAGAPGSGTVTSVSGSGGTTGMTLTGGPITTTGTLTLGGTLGIANGGTGGTTALAARTNLEAAKNHGEYQAGLVVNGYDLVTRAGILYWSVSAQFTTTNWATDSAQFVAIGVDPGYVDAGLATKATTRRNGIDVIGLVTDRYEGTTDTDGHLQFDLSAYTSIKLTGGGGNDRALIATPDDSTPATYRIAFTEDTGDPANTRSAWFTIEAILV